MQIQVDLSGLTEDEFVVFVEAVDQEVTLEGDHQLAVAIRTALKRHRIEPKRVVAIPLPGGRTELEARDILIRVLTRDRFTANNQPVLARAARQILTSLDPEGSPWAHEGWEPN